MRIIYTHEKVEILYIRENSSRTMSRTYPYLTGFESSKGKKYPYLSISVSSTQRTYPFLAGFDRGTGRTNP